MIISVTKKLGDTDYTFQTRDIDNVDAFKEAAKIAQEVPAVCGWCDSVNLKLVSEQGTRAKDNKTFDYIKVKCYDCFGFKKMGIRQDDKMWFFHVWEKYNKVTGENEKLEKKS
jgi:hypothetical protein